MRCVPQRGKELLHRSADARAASPSVLLPLGSHIVVLGFISDISVAIVWPGLLPDSLCSAQSMFASPLNLSEKP